jgi:hypothetical protein
VQAWDFSVLSFYSNVALKSIGVCTTEHTKSYQWQLHDKYEVDSLAMLKSWQRLLRCELPICGRFIHAYKLPTLRTSHVHACQQTTKCCKSSCTITSKINMGHINIIHVHSVREAMQMRHMK